jgi:serine/threonine protein kinase
MNELAGHHLGGYYLEEEVGRGAMGVVYRAKQLTLGREVAVKVLPQGLARDASYVARFTREARIIAGLNHPNIVQIYDAGEQQNLLFFAMEFVQGPTLASLLYLDGTISPYYSSEYAAQIADALDAAYRERNVIHRDIKPENLMLSRWGKVKVMDFGLARAPGLQVITVAKTLVGSIYYASPEQIWGEVIDNRSDIYALGVVLYEMVCGRRPFTGRTMPEVTQTIIQGMLQPPSVHNPNIPVELERIILTALARNRDDRYEDASIMAKELRSLRLDPPSGPVPSQSPYGVHGKTTPYLPKRPQVTLPRYLTLEQENTQRTQAIPPQDMARTGEVPTTPILPSFPQREERQISQDQQKQSYPSQDENDQQNPKIWNPLHKLFKAPEQ